MENRRVSDSNKHLMQRFYDEVVNEGNLKGARAEFDTYMKLAPNGPNAAQAKALAAQLPQ